MFKNPAHCPLCPSKDISIDYGLVDDDNNLPDKVSQGGETPFFCWNCGHEWFDTLIVIIHHTKDSK